MTLPVRRVIAALVLGGALVTSGCGANEANQAAVVDGTVITETEVQTAQRQINATFPSANLTVSNVLSRLIQAPVVLSFAEEQGSPVSETVARSLYEQQEAWDGEDPARSTVEVLRAELAIQGLQQSGAQVPVSEFETLRVRLNPRYGTFDPATASVATSMPAWITPYDANQ